MTRWNFPTDLLPHSAKMVLVEFDHGVLKVRQDDAGEVDYAFSNKFELRIGAEHRRGPKQSEPGMYACIKHGPKCLGNDSQKLEFDLDNGEAYFHILLQGKDQKSITLKKVKSDYSNIERLTALN